MFVDGKLNFGLRFSEFRRFEGALSHGNFVCLYFSRFWMHLHTCTVSNFFQEYEMIRFLHCFIPQEIGQASY